MYIYGFQNKIFEKNVDVHLAVSNDKLTGYLARRNLSIIIYLSIYVCVCVYITPSQAYNNLFSTTLCLCIFSLYLQVSLFLNIPFFSSSQPHLSLSF